MPPERAEEILADAAAVRMDRAEIERAKLVLKRENLLTRAKRVLASLENRQIEIAEAEDNDQPLTKDRANGLGQEILSLLKDLSEEHQKHDQDIEETRKKLQDLETKIQSLEAIFPGQAEKN